MFGGHWPFVLIHLIDKFMLHSSENDKQCNIDYLFKPQIYLFTTTYILSCQLLSCPNESLMVASRETESVIYAIKLSGQYQWILPKKVKIKMLTKNSDLHFLSENRLFMFMDWLQALVQLIVWPFIEVQHWVNPSPMWCMMLTNWTTILFVKANVLICHNRSWNKPDNSPDVKEILY